jgi:hypothetical protein
MRAGLLYSMRGMRIGEVMNGCIFDAHGNLHASSHECTPDDWYELRSSLTRIHTEAMNNQSANRSKLVLSHLELSRAKSAQALDQFYSDMQCVRPRILVEEAAIKADNQKSLRDMRGILYTYMGHYHLDDDEKLVLGLSR